jgi:hypothetical protein
LEQADSSACGGVSEVSQGGFDVYSELCCDDAAGRIDAVLVPDFSGGSLGFSPGREREVCVGHCSGGPSTEDRGQLLMVADERSSRSAVQIDGARHSPIA